eukprot:scaffold10382_cov103-Cylindrotheca_fusiformis.AAC.2
MGKGDKKGAIFAMKQKKLYEQELSKIRQKNSLQLHQLLGTNTTTMAPPTIRNADNDVGIEKGGNNNRRRRSITGGTQSLRNGSVQFVTTTTTRRTITTSKKRTFGACYFLTANMSVVLNPHENPTTNMMH